MVKSNRRAKDNTLANLKKPGAALTEAGMTDGMVMADKTQTKEPKLVS